MSHLFRAAIPLCAALAACSTVNSSPIPPLNSSADRTIFDPPTTPATSGAGIAYFLPRQLARVTVKRTETTLADAIKLLGEKELALSIANAKVAAAKSGIKDSEDLLVAKGDIPAIRDLLLARIKEQKDALPIIAKAASDAKDGRAKAADTVAGAARPGGGGKFKVSLNIELLPPSADPRYGYRLRPQHSAFRDDTQIYDVGPNGLLNSLDIVAADRTGDILVELATFAGGVTTLATAALAEDACNASNPTEVSAVVDLADETSLNKMNTIIKCLGAELKPVEKSTFGTEPRIGTARAGVAGVVYRTPVDVLLQIKNCEFTDTGPCRNPNPETWHVAQIIAVSLPQAGPISYVTQNAGFMTTTKYKVGFKDGVLVKYDSTRPSEVLEVARTPMRMINGFFEGASKIISIRTGQNNARATMVQSETALQTAQLNSQTAVSAAQLAAEQALLRDQSKRDAMNRCIGERVTRGEPYDSCFAGP